MRNGRAYLIYYVANEVERGRVKDTKECRTVSITPEALGLPSTRIGLPPMYFETCLSSGSNVGLYEEAAANQVKPDE